MKHTKGPWDSGNWHTTRRLSVWAVSPTGSRKRVCTVDEYPSRGASEPSPSNANARLIAAAPDMYAALQSILAAETLHADPNSPVPAIVRAAIAKAEGREVAG